MALVLSNVVLIPAGWGQLVASPWGQVTTLHWAFLAYSIFLAMGYGMIMWYRSVKHRGASRTVVYQYLMPIVALGAAVAFLRERPTGWQLAGIAVTLVGVYFASQRPDSLQPGPVAQK
jgi:drug/metabolite transporter (DMT)-like permease